jgi:transcriptional regulator GlxA family with amidase domain
MELILDELRLAPTVPLHVPMPKSDRLLRVCYAILRNPAKELALDKCADAAAMGRRTFTRAFRRETGMSYAMWCQNVRLMEAVSLLASGQSVTSVALDVGYSSPSAFTAMFRRVFGVPPSHYSVE